MKGFTLKNHLEEGFMKDLTVLILAGGDADRFWPLTDKHSLFFLGKSLAHHCLLQLSKFGFRNIVVVTNSNNEMLFKNIKDEFGDLNIDVILQTDSRGMAGAIVSAQKYIKGKKLLVISSADIYEDVLLSSFIKVFKHNPDSIITGVRQDIYFPGGYLKVEGDNIISIIEKPSIENLPSNLVTIIFDYFKNADLLLDAISKVKVSTDDIFEKAIDLLIRKINFKLLPYKGFWGYLKFPWHTLNISSYFLHKIKGQKIKKASIHKSVILSGDVYIEDGVRIMENSKIIGPTWIGKNTIIGQNCLVRESMIGANCVVGYSTEIARSYISDNCWFHTNYVGDSVISSNVSMGAGTVLANYKLNENSINSYVKNKIIDTAKVKLGSMIGSNVRIGVNTSIMPGIKIGKGSFVGAGVVLDKDLPDNKFCFMGNNNYEIKDNKTMINSKSRQVSKNKLNSTLK